VYKRSETTSLSVYLHANLNGQSILLRVLRTELSGQEQEWQWVRTHVHSKTLVFLGIIPVTNVLQSSDPRVERRLRRSLILLCFLELLKQFLGEFHRVIGGHSSPPAGLDLRSFRSYHAGMLALTQTGGAGEAYLLRPLFLERAPDACGNIVRALCHAVLAFADEDVQTVRFGLEPFHLG
jgi:hypothetical protein